MYLYIQIVSLAASTNLEEHCVTTLTILAARETTIQTPDALLNYSQYGRVVRAPEEAPCSSTAPTASWVCSR